MLSAFFENFLCRRSVRVNAEVFRKTLGGFVKRQIKKVGGKVDHIPMCAAGKAIIMIVHYKQAGVPVIVKRTEGFALPVDRYPVPFRSFPAVHAILDVLKKVHVCASNCPVLTRMTGTMANVDELDWLAREMESFDRYEMLRFNAATERFNLHCVDELIDLTACFNKITLITDFTDLEKAGKRHYLTVHGGCHPEELEKLDGAETARRLITYHHGHVTQYGVVYDNDVKLERVYDRKHFPPGWRAEDCVMELKLAVRGERDAKKCEWVQLPVSQIKMKRAILRARIPPCGEMQMLVSDSRFPDEVSCALDFEQESLFELNRLCQTCAFFLDADFEKLGAVCQMAKPEGAANIRQLAENLDQFDFAPGVHTPEELGKYMIQRSGHYEYDENLAAFYNYDDYGVSRMLREDGV